jgi:RNA polymerase sigma factor (sigma-70 family)
MASDRPPLTPEEFGRAFTRLRPREREVLLLTAQDRLTNDEIASRLGITPASASRRLAAALRNLDRLLERRTRPWWRLW